MRADRLLSLVYLLKARGKLSANELAAELEVSPRTILRDVQALSTAGVPIYCETGRGGGVRLLPGYRTEVTALSEQEANALFAAIAVPGADALGMGGALASALRKVMAALPDRPRLSATRLAERVVIDTGGWIPQQNETWLAVAQEAVLTDRRIRITYQGRHDEIATARVVDPYGLLQSGGVWYLIAAHSAQVRFYRLARVSDAQILDESAQRPDDVDLRALWLQRRTEFRSAFKPLTVHLWVRRKRLGDLAGFAVGPVTEADPTGWCAPTCEDPTWEPRRVPFGDISHAWQVVQQLDSDVVVVSPTDLRDRIVQRAGAVLEAYGLEPACGDSGRQGRTNKTGTGL